MADVLTVDARGLACPQPVLETKRVVDEGQTNQFVVLVDNATARENVSRFARNQGCEVQVEEAGADNFRIVISRGSDQTRPALQEELIACSIPEPRTNAKNVVYVGTDRMGAGDDELGQKLMRGFLRTWIDSTPKPWRMIFINAGVKLTTIDDEAAEAIALLEENGVEILSCGTCLQHFNLEEKLRVGKATNMFEVIESLNSAAKVISPD